MVISQSLMKKDSISETQTLEKDDIVSILIYLCFLEVDLGHLQYIRWNSL